MDEAFVSLIVFYRCSLVANFSNLFAVTVLSPRFRQKLEKGRKGGVKDEGTKRGWAGRNLVFVSRARPNELKRNEEFRRAFAAGNLFVNRIAIVKGIYLPIYRPHRARIRSLSGSIRRSRFTAAPNTLRYSCLANYITFFVSLCRFYRYTFCTIAWAAERRVKLVYGFFFVVTVFTRIFVRLSGVNFLCGRKSFLWKLEHLISLSFADGNTTINNTLHIVYS